MAGHAPGLSRWWLEQRRRIYWRLQPLLLRAPAALTRRLVRPASIYCKLTLRCNARCRHCDVWKHPSDIQDELSTAEWKDIFSSLRRWLGPADICLTGGEVLLRRDALDLLEFTAGLGLRVQFLSNGYVLADDVAEKIIAANPDTAAVSLDAMDPRLYDELRGKEGFFKRAAAAIRSLVHHHNRLGARGRIIVKTVMMDPNLDELTKIVDWVAELGTAKVFFQAITQNYEQEMRHGWYEVPELNALWIKDVARATRVVDELIERLEAGAPIANTRRNLEQIKAYFRDPAKWSRNEAFQIGTYSDTYCPAGLCGLEFSPNGDVRVCPMSEPIGNVRDAPVKQIWHSRPACWRRPCPYW
ncbi:MAG: radical SAM protein [Planctomycetota bacterium]